MAVIELRGIKRVYRMQGKTADEVVVVNALRGVDFFAEQGEFVSGRGPSGSGKSTLMKILGCLHMPDSGSYKLDGIETSTSN